MACLLGERYTHAFLFCSKCIEAVRPDGGSALLPGGRVSVMLCGPGACLQITGNQVTNEAVSSDLRPRNDPWLPRGLIPRRVELGEAVSHL